MFASNSGKWNPKESVTVTCGIDQFWTDQWSVQWLRKQISPQNSCRVKRLGLCVPKERDTIQWPFNLRVRGFSCIWPTPHRSWHRGKNLPGICPRRSWCITGGYWESNAFRPQYRIPTMTSKWKTLFHTPSECRVSMSVFSCFLRFLDCGMAWHGMAWHGMHGM